MQACVLEQGIAAVVRAQNVAGAAATAPGSDPGSAKCENDSPTVKSMTSTSTTQVSCTGSGADSEETTQCRAAIASVWGACGTACARFFKRGPDGEPVLTPCVRDNKRSTTGTDPPTRKAGVDPSGNETCTISCTASILCVCDP